MKEGPIGLLRTFPRGRGGLHPSAIDDRRGFERSEVWITVKDLEAKGVDSRYVPRSMKGLQAITQDLCQRNPLAH
jgi:hypothetical protein